MKAQLRFDNTFLFYNNIYDFNDIIEDSRLLKLLNPYKHITKEFGIMFLEKIRRIGLEAVNLQRLGAIDDTLQVFNDKKGFNKLLDNMKNITRLIEKLELKEAKFKTYFNQLLRYFSELLFPLFLIKLHNGEIEFQPKDIGKGLRSCDNIFTFNNSQIFIEITTINTNNTHNLQTKVISIFEEKAQEQLDTYENGLLVIDITASGTQCFNPDEHKFYVKFPILDSLDEFIDIELDKDENKHLIGVAIVINLITEKDKKIGLTWDVKIKENKKNSNHKLLKELIEKSKK